MAVARSARLPRDTSSRWMRSASELGRVQGTHGLDRVRLLRPLVGAIALDAGEAQRQAAGVLRAFLQIIERDLHHQLRPDMNGVVVAAALACEQLARLPI